MTNNIDLTNQQMFSGLDAGTWTATGAAVGAAAGSVIPGAGTAVGGAMGAGAGAVLGAVTNTSSGNAALDAACGKKPFALASAAKWKAYHDCVMRFNGANEDGTSNSYCPDAPEFGALRAAWEAIIANPTPAASELASAIAAAKAYVQEQNRQTAYHSGNGDIKNANCTRKRGAIAQDFVARLMIKANPNTAAEALTTNPASNGGLGGAPYNPANPTPPMLTDTPWYQTPMGITGIVGGVAIIALVVIGARKGWFSKK